MKKLLFLFFLVSCGNSSTGSHTKVYRVDSEFQPYVDKFLDTGYEFNKNIKIDDLIIEFKNLKDIGADKIGVCYVHEKGDGTPLIQIDPEYWETGVKGDPDNTTVKNDPELLAAAREYVIFHELGHCVMNYPHRDGPKGADARYPTSIMNTYALTPYFYLGINTYKTPSPECPSPDVNNVCLKTELFYPNSYDYDAISSQSLEIDNEFESVETYTTEEFSSLLSN